MLPIVFFAVGGVLIIVAIILCAQAGSYAEKLRKLEEAPTVGGDCFARRQLASVEVGGVRKLFRELEEAPTVFANYWRRQFDGRRSAERPFFFATTRGGGADGRRTYAENWRSRTANCSKPSTPPSRR